MFSSFRRGISLNSKKLSPKLQIRNYISNNSALPEQEKALTGYRKYAQQFKSKPGSYMTTFAILHEVTAVLPFPFIYYALDSASIDIPFPDTLVSEGNRFINKARTYYGYEPLESDNKVMTNLVTTYCIVKVLMPVRLAASVAMTPFFAERFVGPCVAFVRRKF